MDEVQILPMLEDDYDAVRALWMSIRGFGIRALDDSREDVTRFIRRNPTTSVVAKVDGRIVGSILYHNEIAVPLLIESGALLGLDLVVDDIIAVRMLEHLEVCRQLAAVSSDEVALSRLNSRRDLHAIDIARLDLGLH